MEYAALVALGCFALMLLLIFLRLPIYIAMGVSSFVGMYLIGGPGYTWQQFSTLPFHGTASYQYAVIPLFILMGVLAADCGLGEQTYGSISKLMGSLHGGPLIATIAGSAVLGACTGTPVAATAVFTKMSLPELKKRGYDINMSLACISAASNIAVLIPPSVPIVFLCMITGLSVGRTLIAGIVPGLLVGVLLVITLFIIGKIDPTAIPKVTVKIDLKEKIASLKQLIPVAILFLLVVGGIFVGLFPPSVGGAVGAAAAFIYGLITRVPVRKMFRSFGEATMLTGQVYLFLITAFLFARMVALSRLPDYLLEVVVQANLHPYALMAIIIFFFLLLGCVMEVMPVLVIMLPIIFPLMTNMGFDPTALAIIIVILSSMGGLTPPVGLGVFLISTMAKVEPIGVFRKVWPFFLAMLAAVILIVFIPGIATWLPNAMFGN